MRRREVSFIIGLLTIAWPFVGSAQQSSQPRSIGILQGLAANDSEWGRRFAAFKQNLQQLGWTEGKNVVFELRFADAKPERLPALAAELVQAHVDVIVTNASQPVEAARNATSSIPIVMASVGDALGAGYVTSLAHPGGNVTGLTLVATDQSSKRLQLLKEISPKLSRVAVIWNAQAAGHRLQIEELQSAAPPLGIALQSLPVRNMRDIEAGLQSVIQNKAEALVTMDDPLVQSARARIVEVTMQQHVPFLSEFRVGPEGGGLMSYGPNQIDMWRRAAFHVDKILRGAKAGDLPVEQPTKFELVINLKTAKALGLKIPSGVFAIADEVIE